MVFTGARARPLLFGERPRAVFTRARAQERSVSKKKAGMLNEPYNKIPEAAMTITATRMGPRKRQNGEGIGVKERLAIVERF